MAVAAAPCTLGRLNQEAAPGVPRLPAITGIPKAVTQYYNRCCGNVKPLMFGAFESTPLDRTSYRTTING